MDADELLKYMPVLKFIQSALDERFFNNKLKSVQVKWSKHLKSSSGSSYYDKDHSSNITISLSWDALKFRERIDLINTILHHMIHVYCFKMGIQETSHGPCFQNIMNKINKVSGTSVTHEHKFKFNKLNQTLSYWRCNGICQNRLPFKGYVVSPVDVTPGINTSVWWDLHLNCCGGKFNKVSNPELTDLITSDSEAKECEESNWTVVDTEVMLKNPESVPIIDLGSSEDESDDHDIYTHLIKEVHDDETHLNLDAIRLICQTNETISPKSQKTKIIIDKNQSLLKEYRLDNATHMLDECVSVSDIITCPVCIHKMQRENLPKHLNGCSGNSIKLQPRNSLTPPVKKMKTERNPSFQEDIPYDQTVQPRKNRFNKNTRFCPCGAEVEYTDIDIHLLNCKETSKSKTKE